MKKTFSKLFLGAFVLTAICANTAMAKDTVSVEWKKPDVTVNASTFTANEETTILVVKDGTTISQAFPTLPRYITWIRFPHLPRVLPLSNLSIPEQILWIYT